MTGPSYGGPGYGYGGYSYGGYGSTQPVLPQFPNAGSLPGQGGSGIDWGKLLQTWGPQILNLFAGMKGASDTDKANAANLAATMARQQMIQGYVDPLLRQQTGQNPYSAALMSFIGRPGLGNAASAAPSGVTTPNQLPWYTQPGQVGPDATHTTHDGQTVPIGDTHSSEQINPITGQPRYFLPNPEGGNMEYSDYQAYSQAAQAQGITPQAAPMANPSPAFGGQPVYQGQYASVDRKDPNNAQARAMEAWMLQAQGYWPDEIQQIQAQNDAYNAGTGQPASPMQPGSMHQGQMFSGANPMPNGASANAVPYGSQFALASPQNQGYTQPTPTPQPVGGYPQITLPTGLPSDPTQPFNPTPTPINPGVPPYDPNSPAPGQPGYPVGPSTGYPNGLPPFGGPGDPFGMSGGGMYQYQNPGDNAFTYTPPTLGAAPTVTGLQGMNVGQDALMQMMRATPGPGGDPALSLNTQQLGEQFNNSDLFKSLEPLDQRLIDTNVSQLRAGAGSLGQRFGTAMQSNEGRLREQLGQDVLARNAQIAATSFEAGKNRDLQAAGLRLNAAQGLTSAMGQSDVLNQQAKLSNQQYGAQFALHGADIANQAGQFNAQQRMTQNQFGASQGNQFNQYMLQALMGGNSMQQGQFGNQANLISLLAGLPIGQQQPSAMPGAIQDASMWWMMMPYLQRMSQPPTA